MINKTVDKIHIHKVAQIQNTTYDNVREKYGSDIDKDGMIDKDLLNKVTH